MARVLNRSLSFTCTLYKCLAERQLSVTDYNDGAKLSVVDLDTNVTYCEKNSSGRNTITITV